MSELQAILSNFVLLWAVIDPIGTIPVFISATRNHTEADRRRIALRASAVAAGILLFFIVVGEAVLNAMGVPILAFQVSGGIVLFLFALTMIFGESKPEAEQAGNSPFAGRRRLPAGHAVDRVARGDDGRRAVDAERPSHDRRTDRHHRADAPRGRGGLRLDAVCQPDHTRNRRRRREYCQPRDGHDPGVGGGDAGAERHQRVLRANVWWVSRNSTHPTTLLEREVVHVAVWQAVRVRLDLLVDRRVEFGERAAATVVEERAVVA